MNNVLNTESKILINIHCCLQIYKGYEFDTYFTTMDRADILYLPTDQLANQNTRYKHETNPAYFGGTPMAPWTIELQRSHTMCPCPSSEVTSTVMYKPHSIISMKSMPETNAQITTSKYKQPVTKYKVVLVNQYHHAKRVIPTVQRLSNLLTTTTPQRINIRGLENKSEKKNHVPSRERQKGHAQQDDGGGGGGEA